MQSKTFLVVDIGNMNIKLLWGGYNNKNYFINEYEIIPTPEKAIKDGKIIDINKIVDCISVFKKKSKQNKLILTIGGSGVITRDILLPISTHQEYEKILSYEAQQYFPVDLNNYSYDYMVEEEIEKDGVKMARILIVAAPLKQVDQYIKLSEELKMDLEAIDSSVNTVPRCIMNFNKKQNNPYPDSFVLIDIGDLNTQLFIMNNDSLRFTRTIEIGSSNINNTLLFDVDIKENDNEFNLSDDLDKNIVLCEKIKKEKSYIILENESTDFSRSEIHFSGIIVEALNPLINEINKYFDFYYSRESAKRIEKIFLAGGGSKIQNIDKFFEEQFTTKVEYLYPLTDIEYKGKKSMKVFAEERSYLMSSIGCLYRKKLSEVTKKVKV